MTERTVGKAARVRDLLATLNDRKLPLIGQRATLQEIVDVMTRFQHSRLVYVVDDDGRLLGAISLGLLARHVFSSRHEPQIHARHLLSMITAESAGDIMLRETISATAADDLETVLKRMLGANVKEIPIIDAGGRVIADMTIVDLLRYLFAAR